jgi:hypothetical protein
MPRSRLLRLALPIALLALAPAAPAQLTWTDSLANADWNTGGNWGSIS